MRVENGKSKNIKSLETDEELKACVEVLHNAFDSVADAFGLTPENCPSNAAFVDFGKVKSAFTKGVRFYGYYLHNELVGCVGIHQKDKQVFEITKLGVVRKVRKQGIGGALLQHACSEILKRGGSKAVLGMIDDNIELRNWYQFHGFKMTKRKMFRRLPFWVCFMEKSLR